AAAEMISGQLWETGERLSRLRTYLEQHLLDLEQVFINGSTRFRLPNTTNICFTGLKAEKLITRLPQLAVSAGSACTSALPEPSHVLKAMGMPEKDIHASLRFSLGKNTSEEEIKKTVALVAAAVAQMRASS
ncbi:MAG: cysteine desulfurase, partial [Bacteroidetes bacterium]